MLADLRFSKFIDGGYPIDGGYSLKRLPGVRKRSGGGPEKYEKAWLCIKMV